MYTNPLKKRPVQGVKSDAGGPEKQFYLCGLTLKTFRWKSILKDGRVLEDMSVLWFPAVCLHETSTGYISEPALATDF